MGSEEVVWHDDPGLLADLLLGGARWCSGILEPQAFLLGLGSGDTEVATVSFSEASPASAEMEVVWVVLVDLAVFLPTSTREQQPPPKILHISRSGASRGIAAMDLCHSLRASMCFLKVVQHE